MKKKKNYIFLYASILSELIGILFIFSSNGIGAGVSFIMIGIAFIMLFNQSDKENPSAKNTKTEMTVEVIILIIVFLVLLLKYVQSFTH
jgi:heme/copper-type cytochrome/quinol oxidase subunit 2